MPRPPAEPEFTPFKYKARATPEAAIVRLRHHLAAVREARLRARRAMQAAAAPWAAASAVLVLAAASAWQAPRFVDEAGREWAQSLGGFGAVALLGFACLLGFKARLCLEGDDGLDGGVLKTYGEVLALLEALAPDLHPRAPIWLRINLTPLARLAPAKEAFSPHSHALKRWHRHEWLALSFALADGTMVIARFGRKHKTKGSRVLRDSTQLRLAIAPASGLAWNAPPPSGWTRASRQHAGKPLALIGGVVDGPAALVPALAGWMAGARPAR